MSVCFGVIVRTRIHQRCVRVISVVLVCLSPGDPGIRVVCLVQRSASCAGFSDGVFPVGREGRIHCMRRIIWGQGQALPDQSGRPCVALSQWTYSLRLTLGCDWLTF